MIFIDKDRNQPGNIVSLGTYHPYWEDRWSRTRNPEFDERSGLILDLKDGSPKAIKHFSNELEPLLGEGFAICVVPSHDPEADDSGIGQLALCIAATSSERIDASSCLVRTEKVAKLASGGDRSIEVHLRSIVVRNRDLIDDMEVLLLDDVTTTGNSLMACVHLLIEAGAKKVQPAALAQTG